MQDQSAILNPDELNKARAEADKKLKRRMNSMALFLLILLFPISLGVYQVIKVYQQTSSNQAWALAQLKNAKPDPRAFSVLGGVYLTQGRFEEAIPLLQKAAKLESESAASASDHINLANAEFLGTAHGIQGCSREASLAALAEAEGLAPKLAKGAAASTYYESGKLYLKWGLRGKAVENLKKACSLQKDDWVDLGQGKGYRFQGLANVYAKDLLMAAEGGPR